MRTFERASIDASSSSDTGLAQTVAPDARSLSLIFDTLQARDRADSNGRFTATSVDLEVEISGDGPAKLQAHARGGLTASVDTGFGVVRLQIDSAKTYLTLDAQSGDLFGALVFDLRSDQKKVHIQLLLLANAGGDSPNECLTSLDSLDLTLA